jgi:hypothetical protein
MLTKAKKKHEADGNELKELRLQAAARLCVSPHSSLSGRASPVLSTVSGKDSRRYILWFIVNCFAEKSQTRNSLCNDARAMRCL